MTADVPQPTVDEYARAAGHRLAIKVSHLHKTYGETIAIDDVSLAVPEGQIFGLLGPNGAGKTTTVECAVGLRSTDSGQVAILGLDPGRDRDRLRLVVGVQLQSSALPAKLKVGELLDLYQSFYPSPADVDELAASLGLEEKRDDFYKSLSGGQKQRLSIALALIGQPKVAVLDEMTTGLDPRPTRHVGFDRAGARPRGDDSACHSLHGGSRATVRPSRTHRQRTGRGRWHRRAIGTSRGRTKTGELRALKGPSMMAC
jgi:ABC-2 type transport system ATP-binding protein